MKPIRILLCALAVLLLTATATAQEQFATDSINESVVKFDLRYLVTGQWKERHEYAIIVKEDTNNPGTYLAITGQRAVVPEESEIDIFYPDGRNYELTLTLYDGTVMKLDHTAVIVADNAVAFLRFTPANGKSYPNALSGQALGDLTIQQNLYVKNFKSKYNITPQFVQFALRSHEGDSNTMCQGTLGEYIDKNRSFFTKFINTTAMAHFSLGNLIMMLVAFFFIYLAIAKNFEPLLLLPIGFGIMIGNIPTAAGIQIGVYDPGSVLYYLYFGVLNGIYPPLIFLGIGAMTDFSYMISNPKLILLGGGAQLGIFAAFLIAIFLGFSMQEAASIGIIGGADGPTAIFTTGLMAPHLLGAIAIAAYSYMALVPVIQPPVVNFLTTKKERLIRMKPPRHVSKREKIFFPVVAFFVTTLIAPGGLPLLGMLLLGNILKESGVTDRLAKTSSNAIIDTVTILIGLTVGASTSAQTFLTPASVKIFALGAMSFMFSTAGGVLIAKFINLFLKKEDLINPIIGCAGVSAVPDSARVAQHMGRHEDPENHLLMHAMAPNVAGVIGSAIAAGILLGLIPH